jgi:hypothetical protein
MATAFATESSGMATTGEDPLASRTLWKRLEHMVETAIAAEDYKKKMACTEWEAFLKTESVRKGEQGYKKWAALNEYCIMVGWIPAGVDDPRYPTCPTMLEKAEAAQASLKDLLSARGVMVDMKDLKKLAAAAAADKGAKKDTYGLALERYVAMLHMCPSLHSRLLTGVDMCRLAMATHRSRKKMQQQVVGVNSGTDSVDEQEQEQEEEGDLTLEQWQFLDGLDSVGERLPTRGSDGSLPAWGGWTSGT